MHRTLSARWIHRSLRLGESLPRTGVPLVLCPAAVAKPVASGLIRGQAKINGIQSRCTHSEAQTIIRDDTHKAGQQASTRRLPLACSGCGSLTQTVDAEAFGYFDTEAKRVRNWLKPRIPEPKAAEEAEDGVVQDLLKSMDPAKLEELGFSHDTLISNNNEAKVACKLTQTRMSQLVTDCNIVIDRTRPPVCERCHNLVHHSVGSASVMQPMHHPTIETLRETMEESPHKYNHIYHIIDAADFPMSLIPRLNELIGDIKLRTRNRRSQTKFYRDGKTEMSFIITRADLLGPTKEKVDSLMPYLREVLREALGRMGSKVRLGNVRCVSAKRGWWTAQVKDDIWNRGGGGWMVGKVNVGKSQLFEAVYPKGRMTTKAPAQDPEDHMVSQMTEPSTGVPQEDDYYEQTADLGDLLPPARRAANFPDMPLVSSLPGTTASPIRIPFGDGKGELIDLPGLARSDLELFVQPEHRQSLIMKKRLVPEQVSLQGGKSLVLGGGLIRITPTTQDLFFLMYNFTPLKQHLTSNEKAIAFQDQTREFDGLQNICLPETAGVIKHAGRFELRHDVTKQRAGPLTRKSAVGLQVETLPFRVLSTDILIEGVGYIEIVAQVRNRDLDINGKPRAGAFRDIDDTSEAVPEADPFAALMEKRVESGHEKRPKQPERKHMPVNPPSAPLWPSVDVFTPEGRFVDQRQPINGWLNNKPRVVASKGRPRKAMKGQKKLTKARARGSE